MHEVQLRAWYMECGRRNAELQHMVRELSANCPTADHLTQDRLYAMHASTHCGLQAVRDAAIAELHRRCEGTSSASALQAGTPTRTYCRQRSAHGELSTLQHKHESSVLAADYQNFGTRTRSMRLLHASNGYGSATMHRHDTQLLREPSKH